MRDHDQDKRFVILDNILEAESFQPQGWWGKKLSRRFTNIAGAIHQSEELRAIAARFDYDLYDRVPFEYEARFKNGKIRFPGKGAATDMVNSIATDIGCYLKPLFGSSMYISLQNQHPRREAMHNHPGMTVAIIPMGSGQLSARWRHAGKIMTTDPDTMVVVDETIEHGSPIVTVPRAVMTVSSFYRA